MPDPTISEALQEAYASAPSDAALLHALSFWHEGMLVDGVADEIYVYQGYSGDRTTDDGVPLKDFRLEASSRYHAGAVVEHVCIPFDLTMPRVETATLSKGRLVIDGVGREIADALLNAVGLGVPVTITYRAFLEGMEDDGPQNDPPLQFGLGNVTITATQVSGDITPISVGGKRFPGEAYRPSRFPAIR